MILNPRGIEERDIGKIALLQQPATDEPFPLRGQRSYLSDRLFQRQQVLIAHIVAEKARHGAESPCAPMRLEQRPIERQFAGVETDNRTGFAPSIAEVLRVRNEVERSGLSHVLGHQIEKG